MVPRVAGSNPVSHPAAIAQSVERILGKDEVTSSILVGSSALVAQLDRALDYGSRGYRFDSFQARYVHNTRKDRTHETRFIPSSQ